MILPPIPIWKEPGCSLKNLNVTNLGVDRALFGLQKILVKTETSEFEPKMELRAFFSWLFLRVHPKWDQNPSDLHLYLYLIEESPQVFLSGTEQTKIK